MSLVEDVRAWLEKGGYVLEMEVARAVRARTNLVWQGHHYTDPVSKKEREADVGAFIVLDADDHMHGLDLMLECKNTSAPWVLFQGGAGGNGPWVPARNMSRTCACCDEIESALYDLVGPIQDAYAVTEKRAKNAVDHAYEAVHQVASQAVAQYPDGDGWDGHDDPMYVSQLGLPIVVTRSPLLLCSLDGSGGVQLEEVDRVHVNVPRLDLPDPNADGVGVLVLRADALDSLLDDLVAIQEGEPEREPGAGDSPPPSLE